MNRLSVTLLVLTVGVGESPGQTKEDVPVLLKRLKDSDELGRIRAAKALGKLGAEAKDAIPALKDTITNDPDPDVRSVATNALAAIQEALDSGTITDVQKQLRALLEQLKNKDPKVRTEGVKKLGDLGAAGKPAREALIESLRDSSPAVRGAALESLDKIDPKLTKHLITLLVDKLTDPRHQAMRALQELGDDARPVIPVLLQQYQEDLTKGGTGDANMLLATATKIAPNDPTVLQTLLGAIRTPTPVKAGERRAESNLRRAALAMAREMDLDPKQAVPVILSAVNDENCRIEAINTLAKMGPKAKEAVPVLKRLKLDTSNDVREAASQALERIDK